MCAPQVTLAFPATSASTTTVELHASCEVVLPTSASGEGLAGPLRLRAGGPDPNAISSPSPSSPSPSPAKHTLTVSVTAASPSVRQARVSAIVVLL